MIDCPNCNIAFSPGYQSCPRCKAFDTPRADRSKYLRSKTRELADKNRSREEVLDYLEGQGLHRVDAEELIADEFQSVRSENRKSGVFQLVSGVMLLCLSFVIFGGGIIWVGLILFALGLIGIGLSRALTGLS